MDVVASGAWPWPAATAVVVGAAIVATAVDAGGRALRRRSRLAGTKLAPGLIDEVPIERPAEQLQIVNALRSRRRPPRVVILHGPGGYGKSTLAESACLHPSVSRRYSVVRRVRFRESDVSDYAIAGVVNDVIFELTNNRYSDTDPQAAGQRLSRVLAQSGRFSQQVLAAVPFQTALVPTCRRCFAVKIN
jgi:NB-ARC domain